ncbi:MAG: hypothetical protein ACJAZW_001982 [Maritalea sp.]
MRQPYDGQKPRVAASRHLSEYEFGRKGRGIMLDLLGIVAVTTMVLSYALERKHSLFILIFAVACATAAFYAYLIGSIPFLVAEGIWSIIAFHRYWKTH